jgi:hypothetical protein
VGVQVHVDVAVKDHVNDYVNVYDDVDVYVDVDGDVDFDGDVYVDLDAQTLTSRPGENPVTDPPPAR